MKPDNTGSKSGLHISFKLHYHWFLILLTVPYLLWEIYWAYKVGYACIKWHTRLMLYVYLCIAVYLLSYYVIRPFSRRASQRELGQPAMA